jgi:hypothetical protein
MSWQDVKDYYIAEEVLLELIEENRPDNQGHRALWIFLKDMLQMGYSWRSHMNLILIRSNGGSEVVNSDEDEEYQKYLDRKASGLEAVWVVPEAESEEE